MIQLKNLGCDQLSILRDILTNEEKNSICSKHTNALYYFGEIFNKEKIKSKHKLIYPLKKAGFTLSESLRLNFNAKQKMWENCLNQAERNKGGRPSVKNCLIKSLNKHLKENSSIAANRYLKLAKTNVMYRQSTKLEAYRTFKQKNKLGITSFKKYFETKFKKPHRVIIFNLKI
jgi:hypothetical protein